MRILRRDEPVVVGGDEEDRPRGDLADDPFQVELQRVGDVLQGNRAQRRGIVPAGRCGELGRLAIRQQDLLARDELGLALPAPADAEAHFFRAAVLDGLGARERALEECRQAVALDGTRSAFRLRLARRLRRPSSTTRR